MLRVLVCGGSLLFSTIDEYRYICTYILEHITAGTYPIFLSLDLHYLYVFKTEVNCNCLCRNYRRKSL